MRVYTVDNKFNEETVKLGLLYLSQAHEVSMENFVKQYALDQRMASSVSEFAEAYRIGMGKVEPIINDPMVEDITITSENYVYIYHSKLGPMRTDVFFTEDETRKFAQHIAQRSGKTVSVYNPVVDVSYKNYRINIVYEDVGKPSISIRKLRAAAFTPFDLIQSGAATPKVMAYLWLAIEHRSNIIITGSTSSGKTTLLNAILSFVPRASRIVSIEDARELNIMNENVVSLQSKISLTQSGGISVNDLIEFSKYDGADYLVLGEARGDVIRSYFRYITSGRNAITTIHGGSSSALIRRLKSLPLYLPISNILAIDAIVEVKNSGRRYINKISEPFYEGSLSLNNVFDYSSGHYEESGVSYLLENIASKTGMDREYIIKDLDRKAKILENMQKPADYMDFVRKVRDEANKIT
ncbi:flagella-related protein I [Thermoplasma volcanium GSS1]|uniref:Flagella-related protein I n=1 Tax=Thermoplasma volcanium (strain ATCC 51530 / DSM 4299 / JCM 9571 / NBRC 15438 / GSS1) TaxID=273116 RepID=Q979W6_THEVO|nr:type II/IV secretion system ATPase subunit [Thermoplasma volcanium]BAB60186.1 flagella-related protein I [Thermoplasma volcanium GSS1]